MEPIPITDRQFKSRQFHDHLLSEPVFAAFEFWSFRCEECRKLAPIVSQIAYEFSDKLKVFKVNVDENPRIVSEYAVSLIPYMLILREGRPIASFIEEWSLEEIRALLDRKA